MKTIINALLVVEGKTDIDFLSSFIDAEFYSVNGSSISQKDYDYINEVLKKGIEVIVLTDPDFPGAQIRNKIKEHCEGVSEAYVTKEKSIKKNKVGVAEGEKEDILNALNNRLIYKKFPRGNLKTPILSHFDLYKLGLTGQEDSNKKKEIISKKYYLGFNNSKQLLKKLNLLNISYEELEEVLKDAN